MRLFGTVLLNVLLDVLQKFTSNKSILINIIPDNRVCKKIQQQYF